MGQQIQVREIFARVGGLRPPTIEAKKDGVMPLTNVADVVPIADGMHVEESGT